VTQTDATDPRSEPRWFTFRVWLGRQTHRKDRIGSLAAAGAALDLHSPGAEAALVRARDEHRLWYLAAWPNSPAAKAEQARFARHEADRKTSSRPASPEIPAFDGEAARAVDELAGVLATLAGVVSDVARATPISARVKPQLERVDASLVALRKAATDRSTNAQ
jgi:hypothetical protein